MLDFEYFFYGLLGSFPSLLVLLAGAVMCAMFARRDPTACTLVGLAIGIELASHAVLPWVSTWIFNSFLQGVDAISWRIFVNSFMYSVVNAVVWGLMLWAVFGRLRQVGGRAEAGVLEEGADPWIAEN